MLGVQENHLVLQVLCHLEDHLLLCYHYCLHHLEVVGLHYFHSLRVHQNFQDLNVLWDP